MSYFIVYDKNLKTFFGYFKSLIDLDVWQKRNMIEPNNIDIHEIIDKHKYKKHFYNIDYCKQLIIQQKINELTLNDDKCSKLKDNEQKSNEIDKTELNQN